MAEADGVIRGAVISDDQRYRYQLVRGWSGEPPIVWVMLNPSTADGTQDDHTIRKIVQFSRNWGYGSLTVVNLFALRATKPTALVDQHRGGDDVIGPDNDAHIIQAATTAPLIVAGWGNGVGAPFFLPRVKAVGKLLENKAVMCPGLTQSGQPRHPLYLPYDAKLAPWRLDLR